jgi:Raf kinase inhibitor-like YbhB/YbcL family protein
MRTSFFLATCCLLQGVFVMAKEQTRIVLQSPAFSLGRSIPSRYTCDGANINPPLAWSGVPSSAQSLVLICEDPDAPKGTWIHWIVFNIPATVHSLSEKILVSQVGGIEGTTSFGKTGYGGPCPPSGIHHYYFKIYAVDVAELKDTQGNKLSSSAKVGDVKKAMQGHLVASGELMGIYRSHTA